MAILIRPANFHEFSTIGKLFFETIRQVNLRDYTPEQVAAWAPAAWSGDDWRKRLRGQTVLVALDGTVLVGFASIEPSGHIDFLFVHKDRQREGIGGALLDRTIEQARQWGLRKVFTESSITARALFESRRFTVVEEEDVVRHGVTLHRFKMRRSL